MALVLLAIVSTIPAEMRSSNPFGRKPSLPEQAEALRTWRWLVLAVGILASAIFELAEGHRFDDAAFALEFLCYGLIVPGLSWLLLTVLARNLIRLSKSEARYERYRQFTQQLAQRQDWDDLTKFVVQFFSTILPVLSTSLHTYDRRNTRLEFACEWNPNGLLTTGRPYAPEPCSVCPVFQTHRLEGLALCQQSLDIYCLPLAHNNVLVGALRFQCRPAHTLSSEQADLLGALSSEIALAMAMLIAYPRQMAQVPAHAQFDERRRIAYELHDTLAQQIGFLHLSLDRIADDEAIARSPRLLAELEQLRVAASDAYERIRSILWLLRSPQITDLRQAILDYVESVFRRSGVQCDVVSQGESSPVPPEWRQDVFNLLREGLYNVEKHAHTSRAHVELTWSADQLRLSLTDEGVGFDPASTPGDIHYGIAMMTERVAQLHGDINIESSAGKGTRLLFTIPIPAHPASNGQSAPSPETAHDTH